MKTVFNFVFATLLLIFALACTREFPAQEEGVVRSVTIVGPAPIQFEPITGTPETKGTSVQDGSALLFNWEVGDTLGIFPNKGNQVEFPISAAQGSTSASFDGGGWALRNNASYAGYYPFSVWNYHRDNETIVLDYSGQVQDGNGSFAHLSAYDFTTPQNSTVTFQMERQGSILYIDIVVPEPETVNALTISCDEAIFVQKAALNISGETPVVTPIETVNSLTLSFENTVTTANNETIRAYMAVQPVDFSDKTVTATLVTETGSYTAPVTSRVVNKGRAAFLRFSDDFTPVNIDFADAEVKRICVENWDTNGDGELSYKEAAAVTDLGDAFKGSYSKPTLITSFDELRFFSGLISIGEYAFRYCTNLASVLISEGVTSIGLGAFENCTSLTSIVIPEGVTSIENDAFTYCSSLTTVTIAESVANIERNPFRGCKNLKVFSGKYTSIDGRCIIVDGELRSFAPYGLTSYMIPNSVTSIGDKAFEGCTNLTSVTIPESVTSIGVLSFYGCKYLTFSGKYASADGNCLIVDGELKAFVRYEQASYSIPEGVTSIGDCVFFDCWILTSVVIPKSVTSIGNQAFYGCSGLTLVEIPSNVSSIGHNAFSLCDGLISVTVPESVTNFGSGVFEYCRGLTSVTIPESATSIGVGTFRGCTYLTSIECAAVNPPYGYDMFDNTNNCPIYVPNESVDAYKAAAGWSEYADRIFGIDVEGSVVGPDPQNPD